MLASLQRLMTVSLVASACGWLLYFVRSQPLLGLAGFMAIALGYSVFLAIRFILLRQVNQTDPAPQATWRELLGAWWGETVTAPQVFCWRQPFRPNACPDQLSLPAQVQGRRGVVFVHGFFCNRGLWTPWLRQLQGSGHAFVAVNLEPVFARLTTMCRCLKTRFGASPTPPGSHRSWSVTAWAVWWRGPGSNA